MKKIVAVVLLFTATAQASDCIPLTFRCLSESIGATVPYSTWTKELMPDGKTTPTLTDAIQSWKKHFPDRPLTCIYSAIKDLSYEDQVVTMGERYLWIGIIPEKLAAEPTKKGEVHAAIVIPLIDHRYRLIHTLNSEANQFFVEILSEPEFFQRTLLVYSVKTSSAPNEKSGP